MRKPNHFDQVALEALGIDQELCKNCRFFYNDWGHTMGNCQRHAPTIVSAQCQHDQTDRIAWPQVENDDYCGDFKMAPRVKNDPKK